MAAAQRVLIYLLRRDLRLADNPVFHELARLNAQSQKPFTHVLPLYVFPATQIEVSGFLSSDSDPSPYDEARSRVGRFWRCGKHRATFTAESVWDLKTDLERISSGLTLRCGTIKDVVRSILDAYRSRKDVEIHGLWMTGEEGWEEKVEEDQVSSLLRQEDKEFRLWQDEKYFVDDRDLPFREAHELSDVFTTFRKTVEPLRDVPRKEHPAPGQLPPLPSHIPEQLAPFMIPDSLDGVIAALHKPLDRNDQLPNAPVLPEGAESAHPFAGGSKAGHERVTHLIESGSMSAYKDTRNGLLGLDFSTKLSAWLALGCITARQVHWRLVDFEHGKTEIGKEVDGYGKGENQGTSAVRFELLWRDYMRLCTRKFGVRLFYVTGYRQDQHASSKFISSPYSHSTKKKNTKGADDENTRIAVERFLTGRTGTGLIDASQRELFLTGWTSNRARQNVASYLAKHLGIDWRIGAEWYEMNLIDYDVSSNWGNWQYVSGVGNDPRGDARVFNPVKQAVDYDTNGKYIRTWIPELRRVGRISKEQDADIASGQRGPTSAPADDPASTPSREDLEALMGVFQPFRIPDDEKNRLGLTGIDWVESPLVRIDFSVNRRGGTRRSNRGESGNNRRGGRARGRGRGDNNRGGS